MATQKHMRCAGLFFGLLITLVLPTAAYALIEVHSGNKPVQDRGWPTGSEAVANLSSRLGYQVGPPFGGGEYFFEYHCTDTDDFNRALTLFGKIISPRMATRSLMSIGGQNTWIVDAKPLLLVVHDWTKRPWNKGPDQGSTEEQTRVDWSFGVWVPNNFHRLFSSPDKYFNVDHPNFRQPVPRPRIDVYLGSECPIVWKDVDVPDNVKVIDTRTKIRPLDKIGSGNVRGRVFDMATHQVIVDANVVLSPRTGPNLPSKTDDTGFFEIPSVPEGYYEVQVGADGYANRNVCVYRNGPGNVRLDLDVLLAKAVSRKGIVKDSQGNPMSGATVQAQNTLGFDGLGYQCAIKPQTSTDDKGCFELTSLPEGFTQIRCQVPSYHQKTPTSTLYDLSAQPWRKIPPIEIVMSGTGSVRGKVTGPDGKAPTRPFIANIEPKGGSVVGSWGGSMQCREDGSFEFKGVPPGDYVVTTHPNPMRSGEASAPISVTIAVGKAIDLEITNEYAHARKRR
jgi:hypothetical protein